MTNGDRVPLVWLIGHPLYGMKRKAFLLMWDSPKPKMTTSATLGLGKNCPHIKTILLLWGQFLLQSQGLDLWSFRHFCCPTLKRLSFSFYLIRHEPMVDRISLVWKYDETFIIQSPSRTKVWIVMLFILLRIYKFERIKTLLYCNLYIIDRIKVEWGEEKKMKNEKDKFTVEIKKNGLLLTFTFCEIFYILASEHVLMCMLRGPFIFLSKS